jgi:hypothetical protein
LASIVGSIRALVCRCVVVVVVVDVCGVVSQPTSAITQTPKTSGINFFMNTLLPKKPASFDSFFRVSKPRGRSVDLCSKIDNAASGLYY